MSTMASNRRLEEHVREDEEYSGGLCVGRARIEELTAERASLTAWTEQAKAEHDTLASCICEPEGAATIPDRKFVVLVWAVGCLKDPYAALGTEQICRRIGLARRSTSCSIFRRLPKE